MRIPSGNAIKYLIDIFIRKSQKESPKQPRGFEIIYNSGPCVACDYFEVRAFVDGRLVGESHGHFFPGVEYRITKIQVYSEHRGKGYGRKISLRLADEARAAGCKTLIFEGVDLNNAPAVGLYQALGCIPGKSKTYHPKKDFSLTL